MKQNFSRSQTECLKGVFALGIVICHLCSRTGLGSSVGLGPIYTALGYWGVSVFLFITGFGLMMRYMSVRGGYFVKYLRNRILPIYSLNVLLIVVYTLLKLLVGKEFTMVELVMSFGFGKTIVQFGWYLQVCMLFYLLFYMSFKWIKQLIVGILFYCFLTMTYCLISFLMNVYSTWFECSLSVIAGMIMAMFNTKISAFLRSKQVVFLVILGLAFVITFVLSGHKIFSTDMKLLFKVISSACFSITVYFASCFFPLKGKVFEWLGGHYLEIYVLQGVSILLADRYIGKDNTCLYFSFCFFLSMLLAAVCKNPISRYMALVKKK